MAADTLYNWGEARKLARAGWAVRRINWQPPDGAQWLVFRGHGFEFVDADGQWRVPQDADMTDDEYLAKDYTTAPWDGGTLPACSRPGIPADLPAVSVSYGPPSDCGPGVIVGDQSGGGTLVPLSPAPVLEYMIISATLSASFPPAGVTVSRNGFLIVPPGYLGAVRVEAKFATENAPAGCYCWVRVGEPVSTAALSEPYVFPRDQVSALPGSTAAPCLGPVLANSYHPTAADLAAGIVRGTTIYDAGYLDTTAAPSVILEGTPPGALRAIAMQPEEVVYARLDAVMPDGSHYPFYASLTLGPWAVQPVVITFASVLSPSADGSVRTGFGPDGVADETEMPVGTDDVYASCYLTTPAELTLTVSVTATGGKAGTIVALTLSINSVDQTLTGPVDGAVWSNSDPYTVTLGSTYTYSATFTQASDERGPSVTHTQTGSFTVPSLC